MSTRKKSSGKKRAGRPWWKRLFRGILTFIAGYFALCLLLLVLYRFVSPPVTALQVQRRIESLFGQQPYHVRYDPVPGDDISRNLRHAVVAAEDGRFYQHHGVDWSAVQTAVDENMNGRRRWRGGSTITQQLVKNLFMGTRGSFVRKAAEVPLAYMAELVLPKERILTLYLNVIEWGPGVYGAEAAARYHYDKSAERLTRHQAASLAACIPAPRKRTPGNVGWYTRIIQRRMTQMGY